MPIPTNLPKAGQDIFESTMSALKGKTNKRTGKPYTDEERARIAWSAVKNKYKKVGEEWQAKTDDGFEEEVFSELLEFKSENGKYYFKGYLSTGDIDYVNDLVTQECMKDMLNQVNAGIEGTIRSMKGSDDHDVYFTGDTQRIPISRLTGATLDAKGVLVEGMFNSDHPEFPKVWNQIQNGFIDGLSIEYKPVDFAFKDIEGKKVRVLNKVMLKGYGHTPRPANPYCKLNDFFVKSLEFADAEDFIETKSLHDTVVSHLHEDIKEYEKMIEDDKELLSKLGGEDVKEEVKEKEESEEEKKKRLEEEDKKKKEADCSSEKKGEAEVKAQPAPQTEVKTEVTEEKVEVKAETKSITLDDIKALIKEELKNLPIEKKNLSDTPEKNELEGAVKSETITDMVVKSLRGGN